MWLLYGKLSFYGYHTSLLVAPALKLVWLIAVSTLCVLVLAIIPDIGLLAKEGSKTLTVYLFHFFPIYILQKMGFQSESLLILIVVALGIHVITSFAHQFKIIRWMTCPIIRKSKDL